MKELAYNFPCMTCGQSTTKEFYMVHDHLWEEATGVLPNPELRMVGGRIVGGQHLCIGCLERHLGRRVHREDFTDAPCNWGGFRQSRRLRKRLRNR